MIHANLSPQSHPAPRNRHAQGGVALVITLIVLVIVTLLSLSTVRTTTLQERMSANVLDRELTFQTAESILRLAENAVANNPDIAAHGGIDCSPGSTASCNPIPADADAAWRNLGAAVPNEAFEAGTAQYHVAFLGVSPEPAEDSLGQEQSANTRQYGGDQAGGTPVSNVYRITVRNGAPDEVGARSFVMLQSTIRVRQ